MTPPDRAATPLAAPEHGVTLWGAPGAGKSGLLGALYAASLRADDGWSAHPKDCEDEYTQERLKEAYLGLLGRRNTKTDLPAAGEYQPLRLVLRRMRARRPDAEMRVALVDPAGEFSTQLELGSTREGRALFARIARGAGVLWLFEPRRAAGDDTPGRDDDGGDLGARMLTLQHLVALLEQSGGQQLEIPVALCLSKADYLDDAEREAARADAAAALRAHLGETAFTWFEAVCPTMRCFAISSAGTVDGRIQPEGLDQVFDWLADATRPRVTWRDRMTRLIGAVPPLSPMMRRTAGAVVLAAGLAGVLGMSVSRAGGASALLARLTPPRAAIESVQNTVTGAIARLRGGDGARRVAVGGEVVRARPSRPVATRTAPAASDFGRDSLYIAGTLEAARRERDGAAARRLLESVRARATEVVQRGPDGSRRLVSVRYARAVACVDGDLGCPVEQIRDDFTWALLGPHAMRRAARARLAELDVSGERSRP